jgi:hypothetical protein
VKQIGSTEDDVGVTRALERVKKAYEGDFNVFNAVCHFAGDVAAGIFRVPRRRWTDSPSVNNRGDFFGGALRQAS